VAVAVGGVGADRSVRGAARVAGRGGHRVEHGAWVDAQGDLVALRHRAGILSVRCDEVGAVRAGEVEVDVHDGAVAAAQLKIWLALLDARRESGAGRDASAGVGTGDGAIEEDTGDARGEQHEDDEQADGADDDRDHRGLAGRGGGHDGSSRSMSGWTSRGRIPAVRARAYLRRCAPALVVPAGVGTAVIARARHTGGMTRSGDPISSAGPGAASDTAADAPALWRTRAEQPGDEGAMRDLLLAAFDGTEEADLVEALRADRDAWIDGLSQVTVDDVRAGAGVGGADGWGSGERTLAQALLTRAYVGGEPVLPRVRASPRTSSSCSATPSTTRVSASAPPRSSGSLRPSTCLTRRSWRSPWTRSCPRPVARSSTRRPSGCERGSGRGAGS